MCHLQELFEQFKDKGLVILGLNVSDDKKIALDFMAENGATFPNILDSSDAAVQVSFQDYRSSGVPLNYIIDRDGKIVDAWYGYQKGHPRAMAALKKTGASQLYAGMFLSLLADAGPVAVLGGMLLLTSISTQVLSNNATAVLLIPIAVAAAEGLGVDPKPFIIAICFGASACFATPIGYQTNLLVYGPGGYRFSDYLRLGVPLNLLVLLTGSFFIPVIWSF